MTGSSEAPNRNDDRDHGGFVFGGEWSTTDDDDDSVGRARLSQAIAVVVVVSLLVAGVYPFVIFADPTDLQRIGAQPGESGAANGTDEPTADSQNRATTAASTTETITDRATADDGENVSAKRNNETDGPRAAQPKSAPTAETTEMGKTAPKTSESTATADEPSARESTERPTATDGSEMAIGSAKNTEPEATDRDPTEASEPATIDEPRFTDRPTATDEPATTDAPTSDTSGSRAPSIDGFTVRDRSGETEDTDAFVVEWRVSDPEGDLRTVEVLLVENPDGDARTIERRTVSVDGSDASGTVSFAVEGNEPGAAYELQIRVEDEAGNVALRTTREVADG